jgi:hypothetical protein
LFGTDTDRLNTSVLFIDFQEHFESVSWFEDTAHGKEEVWPITEPLFFHDIDNVRKTEPASAVATEPIAPAVARSGPSMSKHAREPAGYAIDIHLLARDGVTAKPIPWTSGQICHANARVTCGPPELAKLSTQPLVMMVKTPSVSIIAKEVA